MMPTRFDALPTATWPRLRNLLDGHAPGGPVINMTIGEPKHKFPDWVGPTLIEAMEGFNSYPDNNGTPELRGAITGFLQRRYAIDLDMDTQVMVLNGTREGLFNAVVALGQTDSKILIPNPFYQVYTVAAMAIGAQSVYLPARAESGFLPDLDALTPQELNQTSVFFLCSPSNPQGAVASEAYWSRLLHLAETYDFKIFADECYSEIYRSAPPPGALQVAAQMGADPERVVAFIHCRNVRTFRGYGRDLWPRDPKISHDSNSCVPMPVVRWLDLSSMFLLRYGQTRIMLLPTGNYIVANLRRQTTFLPGFSPIIRQKPGFSCGCPSKTTKPLQ